MSEGRGSGVEEKIPRPSPLFLFFDYLKIVSVRAAASFAFGLSFTLGLPYRFSRVLFSKSVLVNSCEKFQYMRKLTITVGQCLALLLWLAVQTADAASVVSLFGLLAPAETAAAADHQESATMRRFERALAKVQPLLARYGYGAAFAAVMAEGMGIPTPGQTLLMAGALEAAEGRMNIAVLLFVVTAAAALGNSLGYAVGRWGGRVALNKLRVNSQRQQRLEDLFKQRGGLVILLARFLDGLRQLNGIVAGVLQMPWWTFTAYNVAGAILWTFSWGLGTYILGRDLHFLAAFFHRHSRLLYVLSVIAFAALLMYMLRLRKAHSEP
jgi:membrane protein DedA with SNARE-associated domain